MTEEIKIKLSDAGMDVNSALKRFMNNEALLDKFMIKFMADPSYQQLVDAVNNKDNDSAFAASHTLKGVAANFSFIDLENSVSKQCEEFRAKNTERGCEMMDDVSEKYNKIMAVLKEYY